jgi:hypothetical protein
VLCASTRLQAPREALHVEELERAAALVQGGATPRTSRDRIKSKLLFPAIHVNVNILKTSPGYVFGFRRFLPNGIWRAIDVMIGRKREVYDR